MNKVLNWHTGIKKHDQRVRQLLIIWLSLSLCLPQVARYMAYARCVLSVHSGSNSVCDCEKLNSQAPLSPALPGSDKQKEITQQTDWNYLEQDALLALQQLPVSCAVYPPPHPSFLVNNRLKDIFHPPRFAYLLL